MRNLFILILFFTITAARSQTPTNDSDSLLDILDPKVAEEVIATFKSTRVVNGQSVQTLGSHVLDFRIMHRFGAVNGGPYQFFGLDNASMRLSFEYGITKDFMVGLGRNTEFKTFDGFLKYKVLRQTRGGKKNMPVTVTLFTSMTYKTYHYNTPRDTFHVGKIDYVSQVLIARKFSEKISLQLMPTYIHRNLVETKDQKNDLLSIGIGGRYALTRRVSITFDYFYTPQKQLGVIYTQPISIGVDIETGGHVFQLHFTNSRGLVEKQFIGETTGSWLKGDILFGFNLSRVFTVGNKGW
jgi:hypothetical protein